MNKNKKMKIDIKSKEKISFGEFKAWINGMLYGKGRFLPNSADWKEIKQMMEKVVPDVVEMQNPETPFFPTLPSTPIVPYDAPEVEPLKPPFTVTCGVNENDGCNIGVGDSLTSTNSNYGGFAGFGISAGYEKHIKEDDIIMTNRGPLSIGYATNTTGISNIAISVDNPLPCPSVFIEQEGTPEESLTALEKAQVLLKKFKDEE